MDAADLNDHQILEQTLRLKHANNKQHEHTGRCEISSRRNRRTLHRQTSIWARRIMRSCLLRSLWAHSASLTSSLLSTLAITTSADSGTSTVSKHIKTPCKLKRLIAYPFDGHVSHHISVSNALWLLLWRTTVDAGRQGRRKHSAQERIEKKVTGLQNMLVCHSRRKQTYSSSYVDTPLKVYSKPFALSLLEENQCTPRRTVTTTYSDLDLKERSWFVLIHCAFQPITDGQKFATFLCSRNAKVQWLCSQSSLGHVSATGFTCIWSSAEMLYCCLWPLCATDHIDMHIYKSKTRLISWHIQLSTNLGTRHSICPLCATLPFLSHH